MRDTRWSSKPEYRARYPDARPFLATRITGVSQDFTGLVAAVQLRLRVAFGLQALQRCSGLLNRRARGSTVATHHLSIRGEITIILRFERRVCRWESCRMHQFTGMWLNPNSRGSRLRIWQPWGCKSLHAHHFTATGLSGNSRPRRLKIVEPSGCKSRVADRRVVNREQQTDSAQDRTALGVQVYPRRPIWNVNRTSEPDANAKQIQ